MPYLLADGCIGLRSHRIRGFGGYEKGDQPSLIIARLEALVAMKVIIVPSWTDNRGNGAAVVKLMTAK